MQIIPPGSRSGKASASSRGMRVRTRRSGYDLHQDCDVEYRHVSLDAAGGDQALRMGAGDVIYIPPNTISQHSNASTDRPVR